ncbi:Conserved hypothetical protein [Geotrichum candidum]|uniref:DNA polymerase delta subunit 3 n=1 Tax=Geotrichum candidum TaxID=1173061 RepID=A0A0J9X485_GEOCN|nr:Conserved hypothetical protein [Geotrichum candidum]
MTGTEDYQSVLKSELFDQGHVVTYRLLSRKLNVNINKAKEYLYAFKRSSPSDVHATYILTGYVKETNSRTSINSNDSISNYSPVKILESFSSNDGSPVERLVKTVKLVSEVELEEGKNWFEKEPTAHVYSLSSSKAIDFTQFTLAEKTLSDIDAKLKQSEISSRFGKIQNPVVLDDVLRSQPDIKSLSLDSKKADKKPPINPVKTSASFFGKSAESKSTKPTTNSKASEVASSKTPSASSTSKPTTQPKKKNPLAAAFAIQSKLPKKSKVVISDVEEEKTVSNSNKLEETEEERREKARKQEELKNIFNDDDAVMNDVSEEEDVHMSDAEEPEPIDEPIELDEPTMEESNEPKGEDTANLKEEEPAQEEKADLKDESADSHNNSKKRKHKKVLKKVTKMDAEGYLVTREEEVFESCSDSDEAPAVSKPAAVPVKKQPLAQIPSKPGKKNTAKGKQASLMSFFKPR